MVKHNSSSQIIVTSSKKTRRASVLHCSSSSTSSEPGLLADLSATIAVSKTRGNKTEVGDIIANLLATQAAGIAYNDHEPRVTSGGDVTVNPNAVQNSRDKFLASASTSLNYEESVEEDDRENRVYPRNRVYSSSDRSSGSSAEHVFMRDGIGEMIGGKRGGGYNNNIKSVLNSFVEETVLGKMGTTMGSIDESTFL